MAIYDYQGVHYDIDTTDPDEARAKIQAHLGKPVAPEKTAGDRLKEFGHAATSLVDTGINAATGTLDQLAYPLARAYYGTQMAPQAAADRAQQETTSPKDYLGRALGITNSPAYQNEASRRIMGTIGQGVQAIAQPISSVTGAPQQDVESVLGSGMLAAAPAVNRAGAAVARGAYAAEPAVMAAVKAPVEAVKAPFQFAKGAYRGITNPEYSPSNSAMVPLQDTYYPQAATDRYMGNMPGVPPQTLEQLQSQARPTSEIVSGPVAEAAKSLAPKDANGNPLVPLQGRGMEAWGERAGRGIRTNPGQAMMEGIGTALTGIPFKTLGQGVSELGARYLGNKTGFDPGLPGKIAAEQAAGPVPPTGPGSPPPPPPPPPAAAAPSAANYIQRMEDISKQVDQAVNPPVRPVPPNTMSMMTSSKMPTNHSDSMTSNGTLLDPMKRAPYPAEYGPPTGTWDAPLTPAQAAETRIMNALSSKKNNMVVELPEQGIKYTHRTGLNGPDSKVLTLTKHDANGNPIMEVEHYQAHMPNVPTEIKAIDLTSGEAHRFTNGKYKSITDAHGRVHTPGSPDWDKLTKIEAPDLPGIIDTFEQYPGTAKGAPPNTMSMMAENELPTKATRYAGTPNYEFKPGIGHKHGSLETPLTKQEAAQWDLQHRLTSEPYQIYTNDEKGNPISYRYRPQTGLSVIKYNPKDPSTMSIFKKISGEDMPYHEELRSNGRHVNDEFYDTRPSHFPPEIE